MKPKRVDRLNSLLKEVLSETIRDDVKNPNISPLFTVTQVSITKDLRHAKVYVSVIGDRQEKDKTLEGLNQAASFIAVQSSKKVVIRYFPELRFLLDEGVEKQMQVEDLLRGIDE